jgi:hypothetical protein
MTISLESIETLLDLVEIKLSCVEVYDRDDRKELLKLERCRKELIGLMGNTPKVISGKFNRKRAA